MALPGEVLNGAYDQANGALRVTGLSGSGGVSISSSTSSSFDHGLNDDIDATAEQITTTSVTTDRGVLVKAHKDNTGIIYVGNSDVTTESTAATAGFPLEAGEAVLIEIDNANKIYAIGSAANQKAYWLAV